MRTLMTPTFFEVRICISRQVQIGNSIESLRKLKRHWGGCFTLKEFIFTQCFFLREVNTNNSNSTNEAVENVCFYN